MSYHTDRMPDDEWDELAAMDKARIDKYGSERCPNCHKVYRVTTWPTIEVEDHECRPVSRAVARKLAGAD